MHGACLTVKHGRKKRVRSGRAKHTRNVTGNTHDSLYKLLFSHKVVTEELLRYYIPSAILGEIDFTSLERCPDSFINRKRAERREDLIWRVLSLQEEWVYVYILNEFQSSIDPWMPLRVAEYVAVFQRDLIRSRAVKRGEKLPLVLPVVIYNGWLQWTAPRSLAELQCAVAEPLRRYQQQQEYFLIDIGRLVGELIANPECILSKFFSLERARSPEEMLQIVKDAVHYLKGQHFAEINAIFCQWIRDIGMKRVGIEDQKIPEIVELEEVGNMLETSIRLWQEDFMKKCREQITQDVTARVTQDVTQKVTQDVTKSMITNVRKTIAKKLLEKQMSVEEIIEVTGLSQEELRDALYVVSPA